MKSETEGMASIFQDSVYKIPKYQRGYVWTKDEVKDFLDDVEYVW